MKKFITLLLLFPSIVFATPTSWDFAGGVLQPLQSAWSAVVKGSYFTATSTSATSTLPNLTTTNLAITSAFRFGGVLGYTWADFCTAITGGSGLCDGSDATGSTIATSSDLVGGQVIYATSPSTIASIATGTLSETITGASFSAARSVIGGAADLSIDSGYVLPTTTRLNLLDSFYNTPSTRITDGTGLTWSGNTLNCDTASGSVQGCLTSTDWNTFNGKAGLASPTFTGIVTTPALSVTASSSLGYASSTALTVSGNTFLNMATGTTLFGFGLSDCDTSLTSKLLWDATTGKFSCGSDTSGADGVSNWLTLNGALTPTSTTIGISVHGSSTIGGGTGASGLTVSGNSTTTGSAYFAVNVGIGSSTPGSTLTVQGVPGSANPVFTVATSTNAPLFSISNYGIMSLANPVNQAFSWQDNGSGVLVQKKGTTDITGLDASGFRVTSVNAIGWTNSTAATLGMDSALSRISANKIAVGNGTAGNFSGTLVAGAIGIASSTPSRALTVSGDILGVNLTATGTLDVSGNTSLQAATSTNLFANTLTATNASFTTATSTTLGALGINLFGGGLKTTANSLCIQLTGSADLCDGSDASGGGAGGGSNWVLNAAGDGLRPSTTVGAVIQASSTIGNGTATGGLTVSGNSTTTGTALFTGSTAIGIERTSGLPYMYTYNNDSTPTNGDRLFEMDFYGNNAAGNSQEMGSLISYMNSTVTPATSLVFKTYAGGLYDEMLQIGEENGLSINGATIGNPFANAILSSNDNNDLILQTGNPTTGSITIADGAAGNILLSPTTTGNVHVKAGSGATEFIVYEPASSLNYIYNYTDNSSSQHVVQAGNNYIESYVATGSTYFQITETGGQDYGAGLYFRHDSPTPAANDYVGDIAFSGEDSSLVGVQSYAGIRGYIVNPTATAEEGRLAFRTTLAGTIAERFSIGGRSIYPTTNDALTLGTSTNQWSDLYLAEGGVINFDNSDLTLTQTGDDLALSGGGLTVNGSATTTGVSKTLGRVSIGTTTDTIFPGHPAMLTIDAGSSASEEAISLRGNTNDFFEGNIKNVNTGTAAQSCWTATTDQGTGLTGFVAMCSNNSTFNNPQTYNTGGAGDTSLMSLTTGDLIFANATATASKGILFLTGGSGTTTNTRMKITGAGLVGISTSSPEAKLDVWGTNAGKILTLFSNTGTKFMEMLNTGVTTLQGTWDYTLAILRMPYSSNPTIATNGDSGIDSTSHQVKYYSGGVRVLGNGVFERTYTYATSTAWTGTTTRAIGSYSAAETLVSGRCSTDTGTVNIDITDGTNATNATTSKSYTVQNPVPLHTFSSNNTFTSGEPRFIRMGTPVSSPTQVSCTLQYTQTAD